MTTYEYPDIYVSPIFRELANEARATAMQPHPEGIADVLCRSSDKYVRGEVPVALGSLILLSQGEQPDSEGLRVHQVVPTDQLRVPASRLVAHDRPLRIPAVLAATSGLVLRNARPTEVDLAWSLYEAGYDTDQNEGERLLGNVPNVVQAVGDFLGDQSLLGRFAQSIAPGLAWAAPKVPDLKRAADKQAVERAHPIRITYAGS